MRNMGLKYKLFFSYGLSFLMMIILGITSLGSLNMMTNTSVNYADKVIPVVEEIGLARRNMISVRRYLLNGMIAQDPQDFQRVSQAMSKDREQLYKSLDTISEVAPEYRSQIEEIKAQLEGVSQYNAQIMELCSDSTEQSRNQAYNLYLERYAPAFDEAGQNIATLNEHIDELSVLQENEVRATRKITTMIIIVLTVLGAILVIVMVTTMFRFIMYPVRKITFAMNALERGEFDNIEDNIIYNSKDEFGELSHKILRTVEKIKFIIDDLDYGLKQVAEGNFRTQSKNDEQYVGVYASIRNVVYLLINMLSETIARVNQASEQIACSSHQVSDAAQALSQGASEQASSIEELAATLNEISRQVDDNAHNIFSAEEQTKATVEELNIGKKKMSEMLQAMEDITDSSVQIEKIIKAIEDIAFQTNILALNAAVEAARAGQAGKGFAVVAGEVRNLAAKTTESSKNTASLIEKALTAVQHGKSIADETAASFDRVFERVSYVAASAEKISENSQLQDEAIHQIIVGIDQVSGVIQTNSATAEESAAASEQLARQAHMLKTLMLRFRIADKNEKVHI